MNHKDVVALVTGGSSGLGEATMLELVARGARVVIVDVDDAKGQSVADAAGDNVAFVHGDVTSEEDIRKAIKTATDTFGKMNVAVNCAGIPNPGKILGRKGPLSMESFYKVVQINLGGTLNVIRLAVEEMNGNTVNDEGEKGVIVNTASIAAFEGQIGQAAYCASKGGIVAMTLPIARECADYGIRVATIAPGLFATPLMDSYPDEVKKSLAKDVPFPQRLGKPAEYAKLVLHIIENTMLNGCCLRIDGALRMQAK
ncbi:MAG: 3-hydroxyacyl-CoA dehydrogenase [Deltaproteobacteria bacterium HGW-Deltaproteobacteria-6]|jgi:NAD(P)-dependent dehydrogenase (short-subunit alcohol dehydrogenase family)|nr:MAG: 3-hydroxyacyl-CoA dehydrogenase [Deltaproteobacteria bacterium HGW-Deltaproteobacteria-6]